MRLKVSDEPPYDRLQAFVRDNHIALHGSTEGPLSDLVFAAKDVFEVKGSRVGNGHPDYLCAQPVAETTATVVSRTLDAGADLVGKTVCDEICFSISGENWNYGSPLNPRDPWRYAGGSSSGSAAAAAAGLVDFALGSDCLGSVRVPASYTGLLGMRPTYGRVPGEGEALYCPSMDVAGFMTEDAGTFESVAEVILREDEVDSSVNTVLLAEDCLDCVEADVRLAVEPAIQHVVDSVESDRAATIAPDGLPAWLETFRFVQGYEVWHSYKSWVGDAKPRLSPGPRERLEWASTITTDQYEAALAKREEIRAQVEETVAQGTIVVLPTVASIAPLRSARTAEISDVRRRSSYLLCVSPLTGLPQVSVPLATHHGLPLGLTLIGAWGTDLRLAQFAADLVRSWPQV